MTCREKLAIERPDLKEEWCCPHDIFKGVVRPNYCLAFDRSACNAAKTDACEMCWLREVPDEVVYKLNDIGMPHPVSPNELEIVTKIPKETPHVLDSGNRREFETGAVRDIQEGKGRCDLMPLDVIAEYIKLRKSDRDYPVLTHIFNFINENDIDRLYAALSYFANEHYDCEDYTMFLECAKHFEEGAKKYGERNWQKGIPTHCYIDSAVRHYLKYLRGDNDEPHDRAFVWNILCCIWTCKHKPELNDYAVKTACEGTELEKRGE